MIENKLVLKNLEEINIHQDDRQRGLNSDKVIELARTIAARSLIHAIVLEKGTDRLVVGAHRTAAFKYNRDNGVACDFPSYKEWTVIPARYAVNVSAEELKAIELEENIKRSDLTWQEEALAIREYHNAQMDCESDWTGTATANSLGLSSAYVSKRLQIAAELLSGNPKIQACTGVSAALNIVNRQNDRAIANEMNLMTEVGHKPKPELHEIDMEEMEARVTAGLEEQPPASPTSTFLPATQSILNADCIEWMSNYSGTKFNFLHCDFPYGINHQNSDQGNSEAHGAYADSPEIFWQLCDALATHANKILAHSSHIMFWYSYNYDREVREFFALRMPDWDVQAWPMVWHKSDNKGLLPDPNRYGRRTMEFALCLSRGDRKIVSPIALSYAAPTGTKEHLSMKPEPMLRHFFRMFVDEYISMLDLTCGSGTSLRAAESLGAQYVLGLELDPTNRENAVTELNRARTLAAMAEEI
jgi:hypothetical protein